MPKKHPLALWGGNIDSQSRPLRKDGLPVVHSDNYKPVFPFVNRSEILPKTRAGYEERLTQWAAFLATRGTTILTATRADYQAFRRWQEERKLSPRTMLASYLALSAFYSWAVEEGFVTPDEHPLKGVRRPKVPELLPKTYAPEEVEALLRDLPRPLLERGLVRRQDFRAWRDRIAVLLYLETGARSNEIATLRVSAADLRSGAVLLQGKGGKVRAVALHEDVQRDLVFYIERVLRVYYPGCPVLLPSTHFRPPEFRPLTASGVRQMVKRHFRGVPLQEGRPGVHRLRHTAARDRLIDGQDVRSLSEMYGHAGIDTTTKMYGKLWPGELHDVQRQHPPTTQYLRNTERKRNKDKS
jgi:site-specific recombinase XerD